MVLFLRRGSFTSAILEEDPRRSSILDGILGCLHILRGARQRAVCELPLRERPCLSPVIRSDGAFPVLGMGCRKDESMRSKARKTKFIDKPVQGQLVIRVLFYWVLCMWGMFCLLAGVPMVLSWFVNSPGAPTAGQLVLQTWRMFWPAFFASGLVLPLLLLDVLRVSHRFAGPMYRLRNALRDVADGKCVAPIKFREGDFWCDMADEFNRVAARVRELEPASTQGERTDDTAAITAHNPGSVAL